MLHVAPQGSPLALGLARELAAGVAEEEEEVLARKHRSSDDNLFASSRGSTRTLPWLPNLHTSDCCRCTSLESAEAAAAVPALTVEEGEGEVEVEVVLA